MKMARILLVEHDNALRDTIATILQRERDLEVIVEAGSAAECRSFISSGQGFDGAIVDLSLPDGDGAELIGDLREANPNASLMALTTSLEQHDHTRAMDAGVEEVVSMEESMEEIVEAMRRLARP
jgi:DNA-binding NarL/FixJ family response regulator